MIDETRPIFITGLMRTGSTLFLSLIDGHPELLVYPDEPSFERLYGRRYSSPQHLRDDFLFGTPNPLHLYEGVRREAFDPIGFSSREWEPIPEDLKVDEGTIERAMKALKLRGAMDEALDFDFERYHKALREELDSLTEVSPRGAIIATARALETALPRSERKRRFVYKQPLPHFRAESAARFFEDFPEGKMIVLHREPRALLASLLDYTEAERGGVLARLKRELYFLRRLGVLEADIRGYASLREIYGEERVFDLHYETLIADVEAAMRQVAEFLGVEFVEMLCTPTKLGQPVRVPTAIASASGGGEGPTRIYEGSLERYREDLGPRRLRLIDGVLSESEGTKPPIWLPPLRAVFALLHRLRPLDPLANAHVAQKKARFAEKKAHAAQKKDGELG